MNRRSSPNSRPRKPPALTRRASSCRTPRHASHPQRLLCAIGSALAACGGRSELHVEDALVVDVSIPHPCTWSVGPVTRLTFAPNGAMLWGAAGGTRPAIAWSDFVTNGILRLQRMGELGERLPIGRELPTIGRWDTLTTTLELPRPAILACTAGSCELSTLSPDLTSIAGGIARFSAPGAFDLRQDPNGYTFLE